MFHSSGVTRTGRLPGLRLAVALAMAGALSGCLGEGTGGALGFLAAKPDRAEAEAGGASAQSAQRAAKPKGKPLKSVELVGGKVVIAPPAGYCVDGRSLRRGFGGGFALIASCANLSGQADVTVEPVVMTVQVQSGLIRRELPTAEAMASVLEPARALHKVDGDGLTLVHLDRGGDQALPQGDPKHWRGTMIVNGYMVGLALYAPKGNPMAGTAGRRLILRLAENTLDASPIPDYSAAAAQAAKPVEAAKAPRKRGFAWPWQNKSE